MQDDKKLWDFHQSQNRSHLQAGYPRQDMLSKKICSRVGKGGTTIEIGFGDGYLLHKLFNLGYKTIGQDLSEVNIENTKKQWDTPGIQFLLGDDSGKLKVDSNSLDAYIASEVLEHMSDQELEKHIIEIQRVLKKGAYGFITFPAQENFKHNECACPSCGEVFHKWGHKQYWNEEKVRKVFQEFHIVELKEFFCRYKGSSVLESIIGWAMFFLRTVLNKVIHIDGKSYLVIIQKN